MRLRRDEDSVPSQGDPKRRKPHSPWWDSFMTLLDAVLLFFQR